MEIKIKRLNKDAVLPKYAHPGDAGLDLYSLEDKMLRPGEKYIFGSGLAAEIPKKYVGLIWEKSGLAAKVGLVSLGGVIDSGYRGEIGIVLWNLTKKRARIEKGDKIAQLLIQPIMHVNIREVNKLSKTQRGKGGFGASGKK